MPDVEVHIDLDGTTRPVGLLRRHVARRAETVTFEYDDARLADNNRFSIEPALTLTRGVFSTPSNQAIFGSIGDSAPDTWGRRLMQRSERRQAEKEKRAVRTLTEADYLLGVARPAWGYPLDQTAMTDAFIVARRLGATSKSRSRKRRPTLDELDLLMRHFSERQKRRPSSVPMEKVIAFAIFSTRRLEEITRLRRADLDKEGSRILVRDMKNPGEKIGNDVWCDLPPETLQIILSMPSNADEIFPFSTDAIGMGFTRACQLLAIQDLHFHDLRHDGVSRLFEIGRNIPQVAAVSGHRSWTSLKRYTHLRHTGDKYAHWKWLPVVTRCAFEPAPERQDQSECA